MKENRRYKAELASYEKAMATHEQAIAGWDAESEHVDELLYMATHLDEVYEASAEAGFSIRLNKGEHVLMGLRGGSGLVEPRASGGSYQGGSTGVSFRVMKGVSYRVGNHRGTYVPGPEVQKIIDSGGDTYVTTQRVLYSSPNRNRDWQHAKTVDLFHSDTVAPGWGATYISVSNRQKTSGFIYPLENARQMRDRLVLAYAIFDGTIEDLATGLKAQSVEIEGNKAAWEVQKPVAPLPPSDSSS
jgi:hypothetical protein